MNWSSAREAPWTTGERLSSSESLDAVLYHLAESLRIIAILISPVLPKAAHGIFDQLNWKMEPELRRKGSALLVSRGGVGEAAGWSRRRQTDALVPEDRNR